jgi:hypothetical protein
MNKTTIISTLLLIGCFPPSKFHTFQLPTDQRDVLWVVQAEELYRCWLEPFGPVCVQAEKLTTKGLYKLRVAHENLTAVPAPVILRKPEPVAVPVQPKPAQKPESDGYDWRPQK